MSDFRSRAISAPSPTTAPRKGRTRTKPTAVACLAALGLCCPAALSACGDCAFHRSPLWEEEAGEAGEAGMSLPLTGIPAQAPVNVCESLPGADGQNHWELVPPATTPGCSRNRSRWRRSWQRCPRRAARGQGDRGPLRVRLGDDACPSDERAEPRPPDVSDAQRVPFTLVNRVLP